MVDAFEFDHFQFLSRQFRWDSWGLVKWQVKLADDHQSGGVDRTETLPRLIFLSLRCFFPDQYRRSFLLMFIHQIFYPCEWKATKTFLSLSLSFSIARVVQLTEWERESWQMLCTIWLLLVRHLFERRNIFSLFNELRWSCRSSGYIPKCLFKSIVRASDSDNSWRTFSVSLCLIKRLFLFN